MDTSDVRPIGVLDSGVGGLSILKELVKLMPKENYIFVADQINVPYGEKSKKELEKETLKICNFLVSKNAKIVVIACNTATCYAMDFLRANIKTPLVGTVPAVKPAVGKTKAGVIAVMSTPATSKSIYLKNLIKTYAVGTRVLNIGCPDLENTVETGTLNSPKVRQLLLKYTKPIKKAGADVIVLGCTHYPFLKSQIKKALGNNVKMVDSGKAIAKHTKEVLQKMEAFNVCGDRTDFYTTGNSAQFSKVASSLLKRPIEAKHIKL
jgi:glutamate racemase